MNDSRKPAPRHTHSGQGEHHHSHDDHADDSCRSEAGPAESKSEVLNPKAAGNRETVLAVSGMDCAEEVTAIQRALQPVEGVREVRVNLLAGKVTVKHGDQVDADKLIKAIKTDAGLSARAAAAGAPAEEEGSSSWRTILVCTSGGLTGLGLLLGWLKLAPPIVQSVCFFGAILAGGWLIVPKAFNALRHRSFDMNVLMTVAVTGALAIGEFGEAAAVVFLFAFSELLESWSVARARRAISSLLKLAPETALLLEGDQTREVPVAEVAVESTIVIRSGARVPLDGVVSKGASSINQAPITGESMPVEKKEGDEVFAGTINGEGSLEVKVTKPASDSTLSKIIRLVEDAQEQKAPAQRFVDRFARIYTPAVMVVALLVFLLPPLLAGQSWNVWLYRSLVLLVIACPCALVIATPVSVVSGLTAMARRGVLIKGGVHLESIGALRAIALDKTGTITEGTPKVQEVTVLDQADETRVIELAAAIDANSDHPLAVAICAYAKDKGIRYSSASDYRSHTGRGAEGRVKGRRFFVGNHRFAHEQGACSPAIEKQLSDIEARALSVVVLGEFAEGSRSATTLAIFAVGDAIRSNASQAIKALHEARIEHVEMLSGDNQRTASAIAKQVGIDDAKGDLLPDDKTARVKELVAKYGSVAMVGDGVNDAPAMAAATVGIAMGAAGTDTALETADIALMQDDLTKVADAIAHGRRTRRMIRFNIGFALAVKAIFLGLALFGQTSLWLAILADTGATLLVIANALRLLR
ncbi:MAG: cadmium-translocating P-type ATPase [Verrucomicrobia bacterium]|nr:cadmium-translocating P-type ATPase [Verrucomicrobiota bacterium]